MTKFLMLASSIFLLVLFTLVIMVSVSYAQTSGSAAQYSVTFPIIALGNCTDLNSCKAFCDDPVNKDACISYAKSKGFYQEDALVTQKEAVLAKAKAGLGCDSATSCLNFCQIPSNYDKCSSFAQNNNLQGGVVQKPDSGQVLEKAKQILGCNSADTCKTFCSNSANQQKCADFAKQAGLRGGEQKVGPGGCTSEETCRTFCSDPNNYQVCSGFAQSSGGNFSGPGGCNSLESCQVYCQQNPNACPNFTASGGQSGFNPAETCDRTPNCSWTGVTCYCGSETSGNNSNNQGSLDNAAATCVRYGCTYTSSGCQCQNIGSSYNLDAAKQGCEGGKGTWTGSYCDMSSGSSPYSGGASYQQQEAVCKSGGGTCAAGSTASFCNCQGYKTPQYSPYPQPSNSSQNYNSQYSCASTVCSNGYAPDPSKSCACVPTPAGAPQSCQPPSGGCGANSYYDYSRCGCYQNNQTTPVSGSCQPPSGGCGSNSYYDYSRCGCYQNGSTSTTTPTSGSCPSGQFWNGSSCVNPPTPAPQSCQPPSGGCGANSYYDYSRCGCYQNNQTTPAPQTTSATSTSTPPPSTPQPSPAVKGISTQRNIWTFFLSLFQK